MKALDLFCGAGGASMGLHRAGFDVTGVDIKPQPHYPFRFVQADALDPPMDLSGFDLIWASPPCQAYSIATRNIGTASGSPDLIGRTREVLEESGLCWIIENVPGAPLRPDVILCGSMFGLGTLRHRWFEISFAPPLTTQCNHDRRVTKLGRPFKDDEYMSIAGHFPGVDKARIAMNIDWMNRYELSQAIPPAYSEYLARAFMNQNT